MKFNTDPTKQTQKIIFSKKKTVSIRPLVYFDKTPVNSKSTHKHLGMMLDSKLTYENHLQSVFSRHWSLRKFQLTLVTIYKSFIRSHLDYGDVIYDRVSNESFHENL